MTEGLNEEMKISGDVKQLHYLFQAENKLCVQNHYYTLLTAQNKYLNRQSSIFTQRYYHSIKIKNKNKIKVYQEYTWNVHTFIYKYTKKM